MTLPAHAGCPGLAAPGSDPAALADVMYDPVAGVMKTCVGNTWVSLGTGGGGAGSLAGLSDVSTTGIADGKSLVYNGTTSKWEPQTISGGGSTTLAGLNDVDLAGIGNGKALVYNSTSSKWVAQTISPGGTVSGTTGKIAKFTGANAVGDSVITESSGRIGIGTSNPGTSFALDVASSARIYAQLQISGGSSVGWPLLGFNSVYDGNGSGGFRATHAGYAGGLEVMQDNGRMSFLMGNSAVTADAAHGMNERMTIMPGGNVGIGVTNPLARLHVAGGQIMSDAEILFNDVNSGNGINERWSMYGWDNTMVFARRNSSWSWINNVMTIDNNGNMWIGGALSQNSDARLKTNIEPVHAALEKLGGITGVSFDWKDQTRGTRRQLGLIAQEVEKAFPEAVSTDKDGIKSVSYTALISPLVEAVKELKADNDKLHKEIEALKASGR